MSSKVEQRSNWTPERFEFAKKLWIEGCSAGNIAKALNDREGLPTLFTRSAVISKVHRSGLARGGSPADIFQRRSQSTRLHHRQRRRSCNSRERVSKRGWGLFTGYTSLRFQSDGKCDIEVRPSDPQPHERVKHEHVERRHCKWPLGQGDDFGFCGRSHNGKSSYCEEHAARAFIPFEQV